MKALFIILVLSLGAILLVVGALWLRLHWHLRRADDALKKALVEGQPQQEPIEKT